MHLRTIILAFLLFACRIAAQNATFPLESVLIDGSTVPQSAVLEIAGLRIGAPIDNAGIEQACKKIEESGIFASIGYRYAPGPQKGYVLTLTLADQTPLAQAAIEIPGSDENEAWNWLIAKYRRFDHAVPQAGTAQNFLARQIERHLAQHLGNQPVAVRLEQDRSTGKLIVSFQPQTLPRIQSVTFSGNRLVTAAVLNAVLDPIVASQGFTDRKFNNYVELNLRPAYEERGLYKARFPKIESAITDANVAVNVLIEEGAPYQLGAVQVIGDSLPVDAMLAAARFQKGKLANWKEIQNGIWDMEKVVKRTGYYEAAARPEKAFDDAALVLNVRIPIAKGPLYHFGGVRITGLSADQQARALPLWRPKPGDPYDYGYPYDFFQAFSRVIDFRVFRKYEAITQPGTGDHVVDINLVFETR